MELGPRSSILNYTSGYYGPAMYRPEDVTSLAKRILDLYDKDKTYNLGHAECANILMDLYRSMNKNFNPSKFDVETFQKKMDMNRDGQITQSDLEACIRKYMKADGDYVKTTQTTTTITSSQML